MSRKSHLLKDKDYVFGDVEQTRCGKDAYWLLAYRKLDHKVSCKTCEKIRQRIQNEESK